MVRYTYRFQNTIPVYSVTNTEVIPYISFGFELYFIHKNSVTRNAPDILIAKNRSRLTHDFRKGFISEPCPFATRNWVINPSATMSPNSVYNMNLVVRLLMLKRLGILKTPIKWILRCCSFGLNGSLVPHYHLVGRCLDLAALLPVRYHHGAND